VSAPTADLLIQIGLFFGLPILLVGGAIVGSRLRADVRRRVETYGLMPLFVVLAAVMFGFAAFERAWLLVAGSAVAFLFALERLVRRLRADRGSPQSP